MLSFRKPKLLSKKTSTSSKIQQKSRFKRVKHSNQKNNKRSKTDQLTVTSSSATASETFSLKQINANECSIEEFENSSNPTVSTAKRLNWMKSVQLAPDEWLGAKHIHYFLLLIKDQFPQFNGCGTLSPSSFFSDIFMTANLSNSLFVAFVGGNHWISLVNVDCEPYNWKVYDSLGYENEALKCSLKKLYPNSDVIWIKK